MKNVLRPPTKKASVRTFGKGRPHLRHSKGPGHIKRGYIKLSWRTLSTGGLSNPFPIELSLEKFQNLTELARR